MICVYICKTVCIYTYIRIFLQNVVKIHQIIVEKFGVVKKWGFKYASIGVPFSSPDFSIPLSVVHLSKSDRRGFFYKYAFSSREIMTSLRRVDDAVIAVIAVIKCVRLPVGRSVRELSPHDRPRHEHSCQGRFEDVARPLRHHSEICMRLMHT